MEDEEEPSTANHEANAVVNIPSSDDDQPTIDEKQSTDNTASNEV
jgi:hypothetical protein